MAYVRRQRTLPGTLAATLFGGALMALVVVLEPWLAEKAEKPPAWAKYRIRTDGRNRPIYCSSYSISSSYFRCWHDGTLIEERAYFWRITAEKIRPFDERQKQRDQ